MNQQLIPFPVDLVPLRVITIHSENNHFQRAEVLRRNRQKRQQYREFFLEGVLPLEQALDHGWTVRSFLYSPERKLSDWAKNILGQSQAETHFELPGWLMAKLSGKEETSELIALLAMPDDRLSRITIRDDLLVVLIDRPRSPGNLGSIIRSSDALGAHGVVITGHAVDLYDPDTITASRGSLFAIPVVRMGGPADVLPWLDKIRARLGAVQVVGSDEKAARELWDHDFRMPTMLAVGNETWGLSAGLRERCDALVRIPMSGAATSLNVASATSIILYEVQRQRSAERGMEPRPSGR